MTIIAAAHLHGGGTFVAGVPMFHTGCSLCRRASKHQYQNYLNLFIFTPDHVALPPSPLMSRYRNPIPKPNSASLKPTWRTSAEGLDGDREGLSSAISSSETFSAEGIVTLNPKRPRLH